MGASVQSFLSFILSLHVLRSEKFFVETFSQEIFPIFGTIFRIEIPFGCSEKLAGREFSWEKRFVWLKFSQNSIDNRQKAYFPCSILLVFIAAVGKVFYGKSSDQTDVSSELNLDELTTFCYAVQLRELKKYQKVQEKSKQFLISVKKSFGKFEIQNYLGYKIE